MRIAVYGAGAIGSLFGGLLARAGFNVVLIARRPTVQEVMARGLHLEGRVEDTVRPEARERLSNGDPADLVFLTVKAGDVRAAGEAIGAALASSVPIVALQNGLGIGEQLRDGLAAAGWPDPLSAIVRGTTSYGATLLAPGRVRFAGEGEVVISDRTLVPRTGEIVAETLERAGLTVRRVEDIGLEIWKKLLVNAAVNPVTADHGVENGRLLEEPLRGQAEALLREAQAVAAAEGYRFSDAAADRELWRVVRATAENRSSMLQDLDRGRRTEVEAISGALVALGEKDGIPMPATRRALDRVHRREAERAASAAARQG